VSFEFLVVLEIFALGVVFAWAELLIVLLAELMVVIVEVRL